MTSLAQYCIERARLDRDLQVAPGYKIKTIRERGVEYDYRTIDGIPTTQKAIGKAYGVSPRRVGSAFERANNNYKKAHAELMRIYENELPA